MKAVERMHMRARGLGVAAGRIVLCMAIMAIASAGDALALTLVFGAQSVTVSQVPVGGRVVLFSVSREPAEFHSVMVRRNEILTDTDSDGSVQSNLGTAVAVKSIWVAVDLSGGDFVVGKPTDSPFAPVVPDAAVANRAAAGTATWYEPRSLIEVLLVRAGAGGGVYGLTAGEGALGDSDGVSDGVISAALAAMTVLEGASPPPASLLANDVVALVDPKRMEFFVGEVTP
jgi:hypothetical protein